MSTSILSSNNLDFQSSSATQAKLTASASAFTFAGVSGAKVKLTGVAAPETDFDVANKAYVDANRQGLDVLESVEAIDTSDLTTGYTDNASAGTITKDANGAVTIGGVTLVKDMRVLLTAQTTASENGVYTVTTVGDGVRNGVSPHGKPSYVSRI